MSIELFYSIILLSIFLFIYFGTIYFTGKKQKKQNSEKITPIKQDEQFNSIRYSIAKCKTMEELYLCLNAIDKYDKCYGNIQDKNSLRFLYNAKERKLLLRIGYKKYIMN
jgi:hypothetical protein